MDRVRQYLERHEALMKHWKQKPPMGIVDHPNSIFVTDGVVCPQRWFSQEVRPLFLLKEAYGGDSDWDLIRDHLLQNYRIGKHPTWRRVTQWTRGILNTTREELCPYEKNREDFLVFGNEMLQQIAAVNIRKSGGINNSDDETIRAYAQYDTPELRQQLELIDPTVIICGKTCDFLAQIVGSDMKAQSNQNLYYYLTIRNHPVIVLDYWHPSNFEPDLMNYYGLVGIYQQALKHLPES